MSGEGPPPPTNQQWKAPSAAHQQKYSLQPLPEDFEPTDQEQALLKFYETIRSYERTSARLKDVAARARLAAREAEYQKLKESNKKNKRRKKKKAEQFDDDDDDDEMADDSEDDSLASGSDDNSDEDEEDAAPKSSYDKREEKLQKMRDEVEAKMNAEANEEELRQELLTRHTSIGDEGPMLKKKKVEQTEKSSLIASIVASTPPHDFSKKLELSPLSGKSASLLTDCLYSVLRYRVSPVLCYFVINCAQEESSFQQLQKKRTGPRRHRPAVRTMGLLQSSWMALTCLRRKMGLETIRWQSSLWHQRNRSVLGRFVGGGLLLLQIAITH